MADIADTHPAKTAQIIFTITDNACQIYQHLQ